MDTKLKVGDIVQLKSGGPKMTVICKELDKTCSVAHFVGEELRQYLYVHVEALAVLTRNLCNETD